MAKNDTMRVYIDLEGDPVQEMSAICVRSDWSLYSVFHMYADLPSDMDTDYYSRQFIHGLSREKLKECGVPSERYLLRKFSLWLNSLPSHHQYIYFANDPAKEYSFLTMLPSIRDVCLPMWINRQKLASHQDAIIAKEQSLSICGKKCSAAMHSSYSPSFRRPECSPSPTPTQLAKLEYGFHCSLYDALECYYFDKYYQ